MKITDKNPKDPDRITTSKIALSLRERAAIVRLTGTTSLPTAIRKIANEGVAVTQFEEVILKQFKIVFDRLADIQIAIEKMTKTI